MRDTGDKASSTSTPEASPLTELVAPLHVRDNALSYRLLGLAVVVALALIVVPMASASALKFCPPGSAAGQCLDPNGVAVDQSSGDVYVIDPNNSRVDEFAADGQFLLAFGEGVRNGAKELQTCTTVCVKGDEGVRKYHYDEVAVDNSLGLSTKDVYVFNQEGRDIEKYSVDGSEVKPLLSIGSSGTGAGQFNGVSHPIAVDSSGHVWVGDKERIEEFSETGSFLSEVALPGEVEVSSLAVDASGDFYTLKPQIEHQNEKQRIIPPSSGTYTLTFKGQTTVPIAFNAPDRNAPGSIEEALEKLSTIGPGSITVFDESGLVVEFGGALTSTDVEQMTASGGATVETVRQGVPPTPGVLVKRNPDGELIEMIDASGHPNALALDPATGDLFVSDQINPSVPATVLEYDSSGVHVESFGAGEVIGAPQGDALAFGSEVGDLYIAGGGSGADGVVQALIPPPPGPIPGSGSSKAEEVKKTTATLCAAVNSEGKATTLHFQYMTDAKYKGDGESFGAGSVSTGESAVIGSDFEPNEACQQVSALAPNTLYRFRVVATNSNAPSGGVDGEAASFESLPPAAIDSASVSDVTAASAVLEAEINPLGDQTSYRFEYITAAQLQKNVETGADPFGGATRVPDEEHGDVPIGAGFTDVRVAQSLSGLAVGTVYDYRVVVRNAVSEANGGPFAGQTQTFTTQSFANLGAAGLPDDRAWELVSPSDKHGANLVGISEAGVIQAAASGDALAFLATVPTESEPLGNANETQVLSTRGTDGWSSLDLATPHPFLTGIAARGGPEYRFFSSDLSFGLMEHFSSFVPDLSAAASEETPYLHADFSTTDPTVICTESCYRPVLSGCPTEGQPCPPAIEAAADVPPGTVFGEEGKCVTGFCGPEFVGATPGLAHVVLSSKVALTSTALPVKVSGLYEWDASASSAEALHLVGVLPDGQPAEQDPALGSGKDARNAISADGSRVVFSNGGKLYLRYNADQPQSRLSGGGECSEPEAACTVQLDAVQGGPGAGQAANASFQLASVDGSRVFFTDSQQLTPDSGAGEDLYEYDLERPLGERLVDLTPEISGAVAAVDGEVLGASEDGSWVYFVANGVLGDAGRLGASMGSCKNGQPGEGQCNLYVYHEGVTHLIGILSGADYPDWSGNGSGLPDMTARVSSNGSWLAFMSERSLTGYDNDDAVSGKPDEEVYLYHVTGTTDGEGKLTCASCNPSGARPHGVEYHPGAPAGSESLPRAGGSGVWADTTWLAANVPGWTPYEGSQGLYQSRYLSNSGRLFFDSSDALVPSDTNGAEDVYQYEPPNSVEAAPAKDGCSTGSPTYSLTSEGCVDLISSGTSPDESAFLDASESGEDVFFLSKANLAPQDIDTSYDIYDARSGGGFPLPSPLPACEGDACQSPVAAPEEQTPGSLTSQGSGNLAPPLESAKPPKTAAQIKAEKLAKALKSCKRDKAKKKRTRCEKQARKQFGPAKQAKKATNKRRAK